MDRDVLWAGAIAGALVSGFFIYREVQRLQTPAFARSAEQRVASAAERAVGRHLGEVYGLTPDRIAAIGVFARTFSPQQR